MGFWGSLAKGLGVAGSFAIPGAPAFLGPLLLGGSVGAGLMAKKKKKKKGKGNQADVPEVLSPDELDLESGFLGDLKGDVSIGREGLEEFKGRAGGFLDRAEKAGGLSTDYFTGLLEGDPAKRAEFLAPEIADIQGAHQGGLESAMRFAPRGGERDRALFQSRLSRAGDVARVMSTTRPMAASALGQLSGQQGALGLNTAGMGLEFGGFGQRGAALGLDFLGGKRGQGLAFRSGREARDVETEGALGAGLGQIGALIFDKVFNKKKSSGSIDYGGG